MTKFLFVCMEYINSDEEHIIQKLMVFDIEKALKRFNVI